MNEFRIYVTTYDAQGRVDAQCWPYLRDEAKKGRMVLVPRATEDTRWLPFWSSETIGLARDMHRRLCAGGWMDAGVVRAEVSAVQVWEKVEKGAWLQKTSAVDGTSWCRIGDWTGDVPGEFVRDVKELAGVLQEDDRD